MLSRPPQATKLPEGLYAQVITLFDASKKDKSEPQLVKQNIKRGEVGRDKPCGTQRDSVKLVGCETIPYKELSILRGTDKVVRIVSPLHSVNLRQMALKSTSNLQLVVLGDGWDITSAFLHY